MLKLADKNDLNQISLTGVRAIVLLGLLIIAPRTLEEIKDAMIKYSILDENSSDDILRIDLNTIKAMGCKISRASKKTNYKYILQEHPFSLKFVEDEIKVLKRVYRKMKSSCSLHTLLEYDLLFKKIASYVYDEDIREMIYGISILKSYNIEKLQELIQDCHEHNTLEMYYRNPTRRQVEVKEVIANKIVLQNDKIYLYCFDKLKNLHIVLNFKRIKEILSRKKEENNIEIVSTKVKFHLRENRINNLEKNEIILEKVEDGYIIEGTYYNEFLATQRMLSLGHRCTVLEPLEFRNHIIELLKEMRNIYE